MSENFYRKCGICGRNVHAGDFCGGCAEKADPWGSLKKHVEMNRNNLKVMYELGAASRDHGKIIEGVLSKLIDYK